MARMALNNNSIPDAQVIQTANHQQIMHQAADAKRHDGPRRQACCHSGTPNRRQFLSAATCVSSGAAARTWLPMNIISNPTAAQPSIQGTLGR